MKLDEDREIVYKKSGYIFLHYDCTDGVTAIGFLVREYLMHNIERFHSVTDRIGLLKIT